MQRVLSIALALSFVGCGDDNGNVATAGGATLTVRWLSQDLCTSVAELKITLQRGGTAIDEGPRLSDCPTGLATFTALAADTYQVAVEGFSADNEPVPMATTVGTGKSTPDGGTANVVYEKVLVFEITLINGAGSFLDLYLSTPSTATLDASTDADNGGGDRPGATDTDLDGVFDVIDNCEEDFNPSQSDSDIDDAGDACDCAPNLDGFIEQVAETPLDSDDLVLTTAGGDWTYESGYLRQSLVDGFATATLAGVTNDDVAFTAIMRFVDASGDAAIVQRGGGVLFRATDTATPDNASGYLCGVDLAAASVFIAKVDAGELAAGTIEVLSFSPIAFTVETGVTAPLYELTGSVSGEDITCTFADSVGLGDVSTTTSDDVFAVGDTAFITYGAAVDFDYVRACAD